MEPRRSKRIKISKEGDFGVLLGALIREMPDVFEVEILSKLSVKDHLALAQVNKECRYVVYKIPPFEFMRMCRYYDDSIHCRAALRRLYDAAEMGRLDVLKWVWERESSCRKFVLRTVYKAGLHGQKEVLDWFYTLPREDFPIEVNDLAGNPFCDALYGAARGGHLELVKHLREKGCEWDEWTCAAAAQEGHVHVLEYLRTNGCPWDSHVCKWAAYGDQLDTLKWLSEHGCPWNEEVTAVAAEMGYFEMLKWLHEHGCPWTAYTFGTAVIYGSLRNLMWMHENGCPWDEEATELAATDGHLEILKWLHENGCPISDDLCSKAVEDGAWECLKYLFDNKCGGWNEGVLPSYWYAKHCE
jgi:hypothetical protein